MKVSTQRLQNMKRQRQQRKANAKKYTATKPHVRNMEKRYRRKRGQVHRTVKAFEMSHAHSEVARKRNLLIAKAQRQAERTTSYGAVLDTLSG